MKRHPALQALSSDHHHGLVQARRLVQTAEQDPRDPAALQATAQAFLAFWTAETQPHFRAEEEVLLPAFARYADPDQPPIVQMLLQHVRIRALAAALAAQSAGGAPDPATLHALGTLLRAHIRLEEDAVFPLLETTLPEAALAALPAAFAAFAAGG